MASAGFMSLVPTTLKEASLDSPTFRGTVVHYGEQVDLIEKWLDTFIKTSMKLVHEVTGLEDPVNNFLSRCVPTNISENAVDHDYTLLAMRKYVEGSWGFWSNVISAAKAVEKTMVEPLVTFQRGELKSFKDTRRALEAAQEKYDSLLARYLSQSKSKEPSSLREDAFQLYEARKAYLKTCFDFCVAAPILRACLDRVLTKVLSNLWRKQMDLRKETTVIAEKCRSDIERIRSWSDSMEANEAVFRKQLVAARKELESRTKKSFQPGRELNEYSISTVPYLSSRLNMGGEAMEGEGGASEKQGWLFMRTLTGKPTRTVWTRRWFFVKDGVFGWLVQGYRGGGVEESEKIGVLLCNIKPAFQEDRRFCFEVKTKDSTLLLQTDTQADLTSWLAVFEQAKRTAVESSSLSKPTQAFSIIPPSAPAPPLEPGHVTSGHDGNNVQSTETNMLAPLQLPRHLRVRDGRQSTDDDRLTFERASTAGPSLGNAYTRAASVDVTREATASPGGLEKISHKLDIHRKTAAAPTTLPHAAGGLGGAASVGISALIAASHNVLPFQPTEAPRQSLSEQVKASSLAPNTLISTPAPVNLMTAASITSGNSSIVARTSAPDSRIRTQGHRKTLSLDVGNVGEKEQAENADHWPEYPLELRAQDEHFRMLFPERSDTVLFVFRATWSPNDTQELPGRCFVTNQNLYFYSHYLGLVFSDVTPLSSVTEVKAAPEKDCDYLFLHLKPAEGTAQPENGVVTIKTFLEPLRLLQKRLHFVVRNARDGEENENLSPKNLLPKLIAMEKEEDKSADTESWEDLSLYIDGQEDLGRRKGTPEELKLQFDGGKTAGATGTKESRFKLPSAPVVYMPPGMAKKPLEREYDVSPKVLFHLMFGDKSSVFQRLYAERRAQHIHQGPWNELGNGKLKRQFAYQVHFVDFFGRSRKADVLDHQTVEMQEEHTCYVITDIKTPWHLPHQQDFMLVCKIVITYVGKSKSKLAIWTQVNWAKEPRFSKSLVQNQAFDDLENDALDLGDVVADQIRRVTKDPNPARAISTFGNISGAQPESNATPSLESNVNARFPEADSRGPRLPIKQRRLSAMVAESTLSFILSAISSVILWIIPIVETTCNIISAHRLILLSLALSLVTNMVLTGASTQSYWTERRANNFLRQVHVEPNGIMSRAVYLKDISELMHNGTGLASPDSLCYQKFRGVASAADLDDTSELGNRGFVSRATESLARRIRIGRQRLGTHRNDLIVAMKVINALEKELLTAEWGNWVVEETERCRLAREMVEMGQEEEVRQWVWEYCGSCENEGRELGFGLGGL